MTRSVARSVGSGEDIVTSSSEFGGGRSSDAAAGASDEHNLAVESQ